MLSLLGLGYLVTAGLIYGKISQWYWQRSLKMGRYDEQFICMIEEGLSRLKNRGLEEIQDKIAELTTGRPGGPGRTHISDETALAEAEIMATHPWIAALDALGPQGRSLKRQIIRNPLTAEIYRVIAEKLVQAAPQNIRSQFLPLLQAGKEEAIDNAQSMITSDWR